MKNVAKSIWSLLLVASVVAVGIIASCGKSQPATKKPETPQNDDSNGVPTQKPNESATPLASVTPPAIPTTDITPVATPEPTASPTPLVVLPLFDDINAKIFQTKCVKCHNSTRSAGQVDLSDYDKIMTSKVFPPLVMPLLPEKSSIYTIVRGGAMPKGSARLEPIEVSAIEKWIAAGAKRNESDPDPTPVPIPTEPPD